MTGTVLIAGASGLVGTAAAIEFADAGWNVIALSRRVPELLEGRGCRHLALDLTDATACREAAAALTDVTHVIYTAVFELPGLIDGWTDPVQIETNGRMLRNLLDPLSEHATLKHVSLLQGTKAYGITVGEMRVPGRESQPRVEHPNFYWVQEDYLREAAAKAGFAYSIFRPQLIVGPNHGVVMNLPPVIGVYAAIRRELGEPFAVPRRCNVGVGSRGYAPRRRRLALGDGSAGGLGRDIQPDERRSVFVPRHVAGARAHARGRHRTR